MTQSASPYKGEVSNPVGQTLLCFVLLSIHLLFETVNILLITIIPRDLSYGV